MASYFSLLLSLGMQREEGACVVDSGDVIASVQYPDIELGSLNE